MKPGFNDLIFSLLKSVILISEAKDCILCADEMALKTNLFYKISKDKIVGFYESISHKII